MAHPLATIRIGVSEGSAALAETIKRSSPGAVVKPPTPENAFYEVVSPKRLKIRRSDYDALLVKPLNWAGLVANRTGYLTGYNDREIVVEAKRPPGLTDTEATELLYMHTPTLIGGILAHRAQLAKAMENPAQPTGPARRFPAVAPAGGITQPCWYQIENPATGRIEWRHDDGSVSRRTAQAIAIQEAQQARAECTGAALADRQAAAEMARQRRQADLIAAQHQGWRRREREAGRRAARQGGVFHGALAGRYPKKR